MTIQQFKLAVMQWQFIFTLHSPIFVSIHITLSRKSRVLGIFELTCLLSILIPAPASPLSQLSSVSCVWRAGSCDPGSYHCIRVSAPGSFVTRICSRIITQETEKRRDLTLQGNNINQSYFSSIVIIYKNNTSKQFLQFQQLFLGKYLGLFLSSL